MKVLIIFLLGFSGMWAVAALTQGEYFVDDDPGEGNGVALAIGPNGDFSGEVTLDPAALSSLSDGLHFVGVRFQDDAGNWGLTSYQSFVTPLPGQALVQGEYFIDADPGAGNGTSLADVSGDNHVGEWTLSPGDLSALSDGVHFLGVRFQDDAGTWGLTSFQFFVTPVTNGDLIAEMEWTLFQNNVPLQSGSWTDATGAVVEKVHRLVEPTAVEGVPVILQVTPIGATGIAGMPSDLAMDYTSFRNDFLNEHFTVAEQGQELVSGETADPDGDGMNNRIERAFGLDPRTAETGAKERVLQMTEGGVLEFSSPRGATVSEVDGFVELGDLRFQLMVSDDLSAWIPAVLDTDFTTPAPDTSPTIERETHRIPLLREGQAARFYQIIVEP